MNKNFATLDDLQQIKNEIVREVMKETSNLFKSLNLLPQNPMIRSSEVRTILNCSTSKIETLMRTGILIPVKVGGTNYFEKSDVENLFKSQIQNQ